jgi:hypothetical protein
MRVFRSSATKYRCGPALGAFLRHAFMSRRIFIVQHLYHQLYIVRRDIKFNKVIAYFDKLLPCSFQVSTVASTNVYFSSLLEACKEVTVSKVDAASQIGRRTSLEIQGLFPPQRVDGP